jgi:hypothetical protein
MKRPSLQCIDESHGVALTQHGTYSTPRSKKKRKTRHPQSEIHHSVIYQINDRVKANKKRHETQVEKSLDCGQRP